MSEDLKDAYDKVMAKAAEKKQAAKERKEQKEEEGIVNHLVVDMTPAGLYSVRYEFRGNIPEELKGFFTRKDRILNICARKNIPVKDVS